MLGALDTLSLHLSPIVAYSVRGPAEEERHHHLSAAVFDTLHIFSADADPNPRLVFIDNSRDVAVEERPDESTRLSVQAYPNPFWQRTTLEVTAAQNGSYTVSMYDVLGRRVAVLARGPYAAGHHQVTFNAAHLSSGLYLLRGYVEVEGGEVQSFTQKLLLAK